MSLYICAGSSEQSLFENAIDIKSSEYTYLLPYRINLELHTYIFVSNIMNLIPTTAQVSLHICAGSSEQSLLENAIGIKSSEYTYLHPYQFGSKDLI